MGQGTAQPGPDLRFARFARTGDPRLRDELVTEHLGLARHLARRFANRGEPYDDLAQVASLALIKSVDRYDPDRQIEFSTFATRTIIGELKRHFRDRGWAVRAPRRIQELYLELVQTVATETQRRGRAPTAAELAEAAGTTEERVLEALEAGRGYRTSSLDQPATAEETVADRLGEGDPRFARVEDREMLAPAVAALPQREQRILYLRFVRGLTQTEIAKEVGISQMHVSRVLTATLETLRRGMVDRSG